MAGIVFLLGFGLAVAGGAAVVLGAPIIDVERGWAEVIAGAVALSGGVVTIALCFVLVRLGGVRRAVGAVAEAGRWREPGLPAGMAPIPSVDPALPYEAAPDQTMRAPVEDVSPLAAAPVDATAAAVTDAVVASPAAAAPPERGGFFRRRRPATPPVDETADTRLAASGLAASDLAATPMVDTAPEPGFDAGVPEDAPAHVGEDAAMVAPGPDHAEPSLAAVPAEHAPAEKVPAPAITGRYSAGGVSYILFVDGSIEAETPQGVFRFASFGELKTFIEKRETGDVT